MKRELTQAERQELKDKAYKMAGLRRSLMANAKANGIRVVKMELEYLINQETELLPREELNKEETIQCYNDVINRLWPSYTFDNQLKNKK